MVNLINLMRDKVNFLPIVQNLDWNGEEEKQWLGQDGEVLERDPPALAKKFNVDKEDIPLFYIYFPDLRLFKKYDW